MRTLQRSKLPVAGIFLLALMLSTGCGTTPNASEVDWGNLPEGTEEYVSEGIEADDCVPIRNSYAYVSMFESGEETPSEAYDFLHDAMERMNCDQLSVKEQIDELANPQISMDALEALVGTTDNPLWSGPGCIGVLRILDLMSKPDPNDNFETVLAQTVLATDAVLQALPASVTRTGSQEPSWTEDVAMSAAAAFDSLGDALLDETAGGATALETALDDLNTLYGDMRIACVLEYDEGPSPSPWR